MQEVGVKLKIDGQDSVFKGSIGPLTSDNLGAHCIGGFIEGFNSLRICRVCMGTSNDIQTKVFLFIIVHCNTPKQRNNNIKENSC